MRIDRFRVFKNKEGETFLLRFKKVSGEFSLVIDGGGVYCDEFFTKLAGSEDGGMKLAKKPSSRGDTNVGQIIYHFPSSSSSYSEAFNKWIEKFEKILNRYGSLHDPLVVDRILINRISGACTSHGFQLMLRDHKNHDERRKYIFSVTTRQVYSDALQRTLPRSREEFVIGAVPEKFNYLSYERGKIEFCDKMDLNHENWSLSRQSTKPSKVIRKLITIDWLHISYENEDGSVTVLTEMGSYDHFVKKLGFETIFSDNVNSGTETGITRDDFKYIIEKARDRLIEMAATDMKPKSYKILISTDIDKIYGTPKASNNTGILGNSCMAEHNRSSYACARASGFYNTLNGVSIAYSIDKDGNLLGRALVWQGWRENPKTKKFTQRFTFIDRAYGTEDFASSIKEWAAKHGYWWKVSQVAGQHTIRNAKGDKIDRFISNVSKLSFGEVNTNVPYFDTLTHFNVISRSTKFAKLQLSSFSTPDSNPMGGTGANILVVQCENCGIIIVKKKSITAIKDGANNTKACPNCSINYRSQYFIKTKKDVRLTFSSSDKKLMPYTEQAGRLVTVEIEGRKVRFDISDKPAISKFFTKHTMGGEPTASVGRRSAQYTGGVAYEQPW